VFPRLYENLFLYALSQDDTTRETGRSHTNTAAKLLDFANGVSNRYSQAVIYIKLAWFDNEQSARLVGDYMAGSAFSSGFVVRKDRPKDGPKLQYFVLIQEMEKRCIAPARLALALGVTVKVLKGVCGDFPLEKLDLCVELLNNWTGQPKQSWVRQSKPAELKPVTREMLLV